MLTTSAIRRLQSLFGSVRRTYAQLFQLHPSVTFELRALMLPRPPASATLDLVIARCTAPTRPVLRVLPAALPPSARVRARAIVYERCAPGIHLQPLPTLDARDELPPSRRVALRGDGSSSSAAAGLLNASATSQAVLEAAAHLLAAHVAASRGRAPHDGAAGLADLTLLLLPAGRAALDTTGRLPCSQQFQPAREYLPFGHVLHHPSSRTKY